MNGVETPELPGPDTGVASAQNSQVFTQGYKDRGWSFLRCICVRTTSSASIGTRSASDPSDISTASPSALFRQAKSGACQVQAVEGEESVPLGHGPWGVGTFERWIFDSSRKATLESQLPKLWDFPKANFRPPAINSGRVDSNLYSKSFSQSPAGESATTPVNDMVGLGRATWGCLGAALIQPLQLSVL